MRSLVFILTLFLALNVSGQDSAQIALVNVPDSSSRDSDTTRAAGAPRAEVRKIYGANRMEEGNNLHFFIGLGAFLLFGLLRFFYTKHIRELLAILSKSSLGRMTSHDSMWQNYMPRYLFLLLYFLSGGYIVGRWIPLLSNLKESPLVFWLWGAGVLFALHWLKFIATHSVALIFQFTKTVKSFFHHISVVNQLLGIIFLPICGILMVAPNKLANIIIILAGILLLISLIFKLLINFGYVRNLPKVRFLYFILYLCIFEFIPLAVFVRYVYNGVGV